MLSHFRTLPRVVAVALSLVVMCGCRSVVSSTNTHLLRHHHACCLNNVHAIFVESPIDVLDLGGVKRVAASMRCAGCYHVDVINYYHGGTAERLAQRVREIQASSPCSHVLLVGFSSGTLIIEEALRQLETEGRGVDTTIYIDSEILTDFGSSPRPASSARNVLVYRENGRAPDDIPNADLYRVDEYFHLSVPCNETCLDVISAEIGRLAAHGCPCSCHHQAEQLAKRPEPGVATHRGEISVVPRVRPAFPELPDPEAVTGPPAERTSAE